MFEKRFRRIHRGAEHEPAQHDGIAPAKEQVKLRLAHPVTDELHQQPFGLARVVDYVRAVLKARWADQVIKDQARGKRVLRDVSAAKD